MRREQVHTTRLLVTSRSSSGFHSIVSSTCASALLSLSLSLSCPVGRAGSTSRRGVVDGVGMEVVRWIGGRNDDGRWTMDDGRGIGGGANAQCPRNPPALADFSAVSEPLPVRCRSIHGRPLESGESGPWSLRPRTAGWPELRLAMALIQDL